MSVFAILPSGGELLVALMIGLLLFGGRLPEVAKDIGRTFFKLRRSVNDLRRETGIDQTIRDLKREAEQAKPVVDLNAPAYQPWPGDHREDAVEEGAEGGEAGAESADPSAPGADPEGSSASEELEVDGPVERTTSPTRPKPAAEESGTQDPAGSPGPLEDRPGPADPSAG